VNCIAFVGSPEIVAQVSLRYWAFALHFISEPQNRSKLLPDQRSKPAAFAAAALLTPWSIASQPASSGAGTMMLTSREEEGGVSHRASVARESRGGVMMTARTRAKETYNAYDENQVIVLLVICNLNVLRNSCYSAFCYARVSLQSSSWSSRRVDKGDLL
jgi:hypothetical protein